MILSAAYIYAPLVDIFDLNFTIAVPFEAYAPIKEDFHIAYVTKVKLNDYLFKVLSDSNGRIYVDQNVASPGSLTPGRKFNSLKEGCWRIVGDLLDTCEYEYVQAFYKFDYRSLPFQWFANSRHEHNLIKYENKY